MEFDYDVAIVESAFSGAATARLIKRKHPAARIVIIEKGAEFDRKVGESSTELSSCFMTRILGLTSYVGHHHLGKQGLRMWFSNRAGQPFDDCVELGARYQARLPTFQIDRSTLDEHLLGEAVKGGCELRRPAKMLQFELNDSGGQRISLQTENGNEALTARWLVDASGRAAISTNHSPVPQTVPAEACEV